MHENSKSSKVLSDIALERVMRDVLSGIWEISPERAQQEPATSTPPPSDGDDKSEGGCY
ncbi:MAG: hypothetical protein P8166_09760 [Candidatus Thiodiazotropha sp.]